MTRGVLYIVWGRDRARHALERSIDSLQRTNPGLPHHVAELPESATLLDKARMASMSPFDVTAYLDADTVVLNRLDDGFTAAERHALACCICEAPQAQRYIGSRQWPGLLIEYNTGVLFWDRTKAANIMRRWAEAATRVDGRIRFHAGADQIAEMPRNDQESFAASMADAQFSPFVLPLNWNWRPRFQPTIHGPAIIWHDYRQIPPVFMDWNQRQTTTDVMGFFRMDGA